MTILSILILTLSCLLIGWIGRGRRRLDLLLVSSILAIYWMQPSTPIRHLDFWFPTLTIGLTSVVWAVSRTPTAPPIRESLRTSLFIVATVIAIGILRYISPLCCLTPTRPPDMLQVLFALLLVFALVMLIIRFLPGKTMQATALVWLILVIFIIFKTEVLGGWLSAGLRGLTGQSTTLASALDLRWLGFSYVAFRLVHTLRDRIAGRLSAYSLAEFIIFIIFFPTFNAGPIDRIQRFSQDLRKPFALDPAAVMRSSQRILVGIFNKFVLADSLVLIALNDVNAAQTISHGWLWILLYAYTFRIYFDFAGYTDIAIGMGGLLGIQLPENFTRPYWKSNLTQFWNSWHITLAQWFRAYYFNPLTRALRTSRLSIPMGVIIFTGQVSTMLLIGLWHGVTWNFAIWGLWHGLGLFVHNRWSEFVRVRLPSLEDRPRLKQLFSISGVLITFHYVALGWVWFALTQPGLSWQVLLQMFGAA